MVVVFDPHRIRGMLHCVALGVALRFRRWSGSLGFLSTAGAVLGPLDAPPRGWYSPESPRPHRLGRAGVHTPNA